MSEDIVAGNVELTVAGHVATLRIDRPTKLNTMTVAMDGQMNQLVYEINNNPAIRTVVLTGTGPRAFSAGSDINDLGEYGSNWEYRNRFDARKDYARAIWLIRLPVIAAIRGYCIGGGLEMACGSDIRVASDTASFGAGEIRWGWHGGSGATQLLTRAIGPGHAARMLLTGDRIDAGEAARIGLVQQVLPDEDVIPAATALAEKIAALSPIAIQRTKNMIRMVGNIPLDVGLLVENDSFAYCMTTEDAAEGRNAFAQHRPPNFQGR